MGFFSGCTDARNMISIKEVKCPKCSADMEVFVRDGKIYNYISNNCSEHMLHFVSIENI